MYYLIMYVFVFTIGLVNIVVLILFKIFIKVISWFCASNVCLVGKTVIIIEAYDYGIGYEIAADMAKRGATVILACRNETKAKQLVKQLTKQTDNKNISYKILDLYSFKSVREFAADINRTVDKLDILINNARLGGGIKQSKKTADGFERLMQANYFGPFLLIHLLLDLLKKSSPSRIINVTSKSANKYPLTDINNIHRMPFSCHRIYCIAMLCKILFTIELDKRIKNTGVTTYALDPGAVVPNLKQWQGDGIVCELKYILNIPCRMAYYISNGFHLKNAHECAQTAILCAVIKGIEKYSGGLFANCCKIDLYKTASDPNLPKQLWEKTEELLNL